MAGMTEPLHIDIRPYVAAVARPGDVVLIGFSKTLTDEEVELFREQWAGLTDLGIKIGFIDQVSSMVVARPDEDDAFLPVYEPDEPVPYIVTLEGEEVAGER